MIAPVVAKEREPALGSELKRKSITEKTCTRGKFGASWKREERRDGGSGDWEE